MRYIEIRIRNICLIIQFGLSILTKFVLSGIKLTLLPWLSYKLKKFGHKKVQSVVFAVVVAIVAVVVIQKIID